VLFRSDPQYELAKKNYYVYVAGQQGYNNVIETELTDEINSKIDSFTEKLNNKIDEIKSQLDTYNGILINFKNVEDLNKKYKMENAELFKQVKETKNDILTNDRKTYYEDQSNDRLNGYYYYFLWGIYLVVFICLVIFSFVYPTKISVRARVALIIVFIILPIISRWLLAKFIFMCYWIFGLLPKNVYI